MTKLNNDELETLLDSILDKENESRAKQCDNFSMVEYEEFSVEDKEGKPVPDIEVTVDVVFGKKKMSITDFMELKTGSVMTLEKLVGEPVELETEGTVIAEGEIVVVDEYFGVKVTNVL